MSANASRYSSRALRALSLAIMRIPLSLLIASSTSLSSGVSASMSVKRLNILLDTVTWVKESSPAYLSKNLDIASFCACAVTDIVRITSVNPINFVFIIMLCVMSAVALFIICSCRPFRRAAAYLSLRFIEEVQLFCLFFGRSETPGDDQECPLCFLEREFRIAVGVDDFRGRVLPDLGADKPHGRHQYGDPCGNTQASVDNAVERTGFRLRQIGHPVVKCHVVYFPGALQFKVREQCGGVRGLVHGPDLSEVVAKHLLLFQRSLAGPVLFQQPFKFLRVHTRSSGLVFPSAHCAPGKGIPSPGSCRAPALRRSLYSYIPPRRAGESPVVA